MDEPSEERIARSDARFRDANEQIAAAAEKYEADFPVPFMCECADRDCHTIVRMSLAEYHEVREDPRHFVNAPGHHAAALGAADVIDEREGYVIVEKQGQAGELADGLDDATSP